MTRISLIPALVLAGLSLQAGAENYAAPGNAGAAATAPATASAVPSSAISPTQAGDAVIQWNRILLEVLSKPDAKPSTVHPTRNMAIMHLAIYDAVNAMGTTPPPDPASLDAAVDSAAHYVLAELYPQQHDLLDQRFNTALAEIPAGDAKIQGIAAGETAAEGELIKRSKDGADAKPLAYTPGKMPGDYQLTAPKFAPPDFTHWAQVQPFVLKKAQQFRPAPPPELSSYVYGAAYQEMKDLGVKDSTAATAEQTAIRKFWNDKIYTVWNQIAQTASLAHGTTLADNAQLFAVLNVAMADATIALYDAKYAYHFWRPITGIRLGDSDKNPDTDADADWLPQGDTAKDPSYPGAHADLSATAATVLKDFFGSDEANLTVTSKSDQGAQRSFKTFTAIQDEAALSRIYAGQHWRFDETAGKEQGRNIGQYVFDSFTKASPALTATK